MPAIPTGPHAPISNLVQETDAATVEEVSQPTSGTRGEVLEEIGGVEAVQAEFLTESAVLGAEEVRAPMAQLPDIGTASFPDPQFVLETVHGPDNRKRI